MTEKSDMAHTRDAAARLRRFCVLTFGITLLATAPFASFSVSFSVALGGALALLNLTYLEKSLVIILVPDANAAVARFMAALSFYARLAVIAAVTLAFARTGWLHFPAFIAGLSVTVIGILSRFFLFSPPGEMANAGEAAP